MTMPAHCLNCERPICAKRTPHEQRDGRALHAARGLCHACYRDAAVRARTAPLRDDWPQDTTPEGVARCRSELAVYISRRRQRQRAQAPGILHISTPAPTA